MARFRRLVHGVALGYAVIAVNIVFSLVSVPLALHYLSKERFALWALMTSIGGYLSLVDLGMSASVARLLVDHKDEREGGTYGSLIKTGWLVLIVQGVIAWVAGFGLAPALGDLLDIDPQLRGEFVALLRWQSTILALGFFLRIFGHLLFAHQRIDVGNCCQIVGLALNLGLLWWFFHLGQGVFSLAWAALGSLFTTSMLTALACWRLRLLPPRGARGRASWDRFREIFGYGKDLFLVAVGMQLIMASQTMIITRVLGLGAAATWAIGTKMFNLILQMIARIADVSGPAFSEMIVRGERAVLSDRFKAVTVLTASLSGFAAVLYAVCNSDFVTIWTKGVISWPALNDVLLGAWLIVLGVLRCHNGFVVLTKRVGFMRYVYFLEGLVFVAAALLTAGRGGLAAIICCSVACSTLFSCAYGVFRVSRYFQLPAAEVSFGWLAPMGRALLLFAPVALAVRWSLAGVSQPGVRLALAVLFCAPLGFYFLLRWGLPPSLQKDLLRRVPPVVSPVLRRAFGIAPP